MTETEKETPVNHHQFAAPAQQQNPISYEQRPDPTVESTNEMPAVESRDHSIRSNRSNKSTRSTRSLHRSASGGTNGPGYRVVFSTGAKYDNRIWAILSIPLLLILMQLIIVLVASAKKVEFQRSQTAWVLGWTMILIFGVYMMVLPKQLDVRSNGTIGIKTFLITYQFGDVCRAYIGGAGREDFVRPRYKFATCLEPPHRIVIRRRGGKWDVVISPSEPEAFLKALEGVVIKLENQKNNTGSRSSLPSTPETIMEALPACPTCNPSDEGMTFFKPDLASSAV